MIQHIIERKCWHAQQECGDAGHGEMAFVLRRWRNGTLHVYEVCADCGHSLSGGCGLKRKDHPNWEAYPLNTDAPQNYWEGCRCGLCIKEWGQTQVRRTEMLRMAQVRAANRSEWGQTGVRLRSERNARMSWSEYKNYLHTDQWLGIRDEVFERFGGRCATCNGTENLHAHHRTYERVGYEYIEDLTLLCATCHHLLHSTWNSLEVSDDSAYTGPEISVSAA